MKSMMLYLAGPIDDVPQDEAQGWRQWLSTIAPTGVVLFDPTTAWHGAGPATAESVDYGNRLIIYNSDGMIANLMGEGRGFGTIREIEFAAGHGKLVAVACGEREIVSLTAHDLILQSTLEGALDALIAAVRERQDAPVFGGFLRGMLGGGET